MVGSNDRFGQVAKGNPAGTCFGEYRNLDRMGLIPVSGTYQDEGKRRCKDCNSWPSGNYRHWTGFLGGSRRSGDLPKWMLLLGGRGCLMEIRKSGQRHAVPDSSTNQPGRWRAGNGERLREVYQAG